MRKWHRIVTCEEVASAIDAHEKNILFLRLEPLILHVGCRDIEAAERLLKICKKAGLKRSGIYQTRPRIIAEVIGVDCLQMPIGRNGRVLADKKYLDFIVSLRIQSSGTMKKDTLFCKRYILSDKIACVRKMNFAKLTDSSAFRAYS